MENNEILVVLICFTVAVFALLLWLVSRDEEAAARFREELSPGQAVRLQYVRYEQVRGTVKEVKDGQVRVEVLMPLSRAYPLTEKEKTMMNKTK
jgi:flagellar basal body-associated protein FliL